MALLAGVPSNSVIQVRNHCFTLHVAFIGFVSNINPLLRSCVASSRLMTQWWRNDVGSHHFQEQTILYFGISVSVWLDSQHSLMLLNLYWCQLGHLSVDHGDSQIVFSLMFGSVVVFEQTHYNGDAVWFLMTSDEPSPYACRWRDQDFERLLSPCGHPLRWKHCICVMFSIIMSFQANITPAWIHSPVYSGRFVCLLCESANRKHTKRRPHLSVLTARTLTTSHNVNQRWTRKLTA